MAGTEALGMRRMALGTMAIIAVLMCAVPADAQTADDLALLPSSEATLDTDTGAVRVAVQPGGGVWQSATLTNRSSVRFSVQLTGAGQDGADTWIRPAIETVLLEPGKSQTIDYTIAPPSNAGRDATAALVATVVDAPEVTKQIDVIVELIGEPLPETPAARAAATPPTDEPSAMRPARPQGKSTADRVLLIAIVIALVILALALVIPAIIGARRKVVVPLVDLASERRAEREHLRSVLGASPPRPAKRNRSRALDIAALNQELTRRT